MNYLLDLVCRVYLKHRHSILKVEKYWKFRTVGRTDGRIDGRTGQQGQRQHGQRQQGRRQGQRQQGQPQGQRQQGQQQGQRHLLYFVVAMNRADVVDLVGDLVDVDLEVDLVDLVIP